VPEFPTMKNVDMKVDGDRAENRVNPSEEFGEAKNGTSNHNQPGRGTVSRDLQRRRHSDPQ